MTHQMTQGEYDRERKRLYAEWQADLMKCNYGCWTPERKAANKKYDKMLDALDAKYKVAAQS